MRKLQRTVSGESKTRRRSPTTNSNSTREKVVQSSSGVDSVTVGPREYKGPPFPQLTTFPDFPFSPHPAGYIGFPPLVVTSGTIASHSDAIIIADDERLPNPEPGTSRPQRGPRRDYSYPDSESTGNVADTAPSRKRKRTETEESSTLVRAPRKALFFYG